MEEQPDTQEGRLAKVRKAGRFALDVLTGTSLETAFWRLRGSPASALRFRGELTYDPRTEEE